MPFRKFPTSRTPSRLKSQEMFGAPLEEIDEDYLIAHIDGGARGNPGPAGYGVVIEDHVGRKVQELYEYLGHQTNNFAEYSGLLAALEYAHRHGYRRIRVLSDSELLVKQIRGEYKVRSEALIDIYRQAKDLIAKLESFQIKHVPREQNREADRLANFAMDKGTSRPPKPAEPKPAPPREVTGVVTNGVVHLLDGTLPEGAQVIIRLKR